MPEPVKYNAKVFWVSLCVIFAIQVIFRLQYSDMGNENLIFYLIITALFSIVFTLLWKQFKKT
jgi:hypothetical protein